MAYYLAHHEKFKDLLNEESEKLEVYPKIDGKNAIGEYKNEKLYLDSAAKGLVKLEEDQLAQKTPAQTMEKMKVSKNGDKYTLSVEVAGKKYSEEVLYSASQAIKESEIDDRQYWLENRKNKFLKSVRERVLLRLDYTKALQS